MVNRVERFWNKPPEPTRQDLADMHDLVLEAERKVDMLREQLRTVAEQEAACWRESWAKREASIREMYERRDMGRVVLAIAFGATMIGLAMLGVGE